MLVKTRQSSCVAIIVVGVLCLSNVPSIHAEGPYHFLKEIPIGGEGGWDYLSIDEAARRLYVTHASKVVAIDLDKEQVVGEVTNTPGVHGFAIAPDLQRGFSSNGQESKASVVDVKTLQTLFKVDTGNNPDAIVYDPGHQEVYTFNGHGQSATVFGAKDGKVVTTIALPGRPEFAAVDPKAGRVYDNIEDKSEVVAIDTKTHEIVGTWPIAPGEEASGLAIDTAHHRLFLGCHNKLMVMMDSDSGKVVATVPIGDRVDANAFDPGTQFAFSSNGDGTVTIAHEDAADKLTVIQTLTTERGARTMALDPTTHKIYLASAKYEPQPPPEAGAPRQRPKIIPGSFKILVYGIEK
jgi:DNA-binding beta-propeller fold protein YncE